jgi:hypothetical protein
MANSLRKMKVILTFFLFLIAYFVKAQSLSTACGKSWATQLVPEFSQIQKKEKLGDYFKDRPARILPLPFFKASDGDFAVSGNDTTLLGQMLSRAFSAALSQKIRQEDVLQTQFEVLPPLENSIFQSHFVFVRPDQYAKESEENRRRLLEMQPDFLLCGEYELTTEGLSLLHIRLQRVAHVGNPFPRQELSVWVGKMEFPFPSPDLSEEAKSKNVKPFDVRPIKEMMDEFLGMPLKPLVIEKMNLNEDRTFTLDSLDGNLQSGTFYKMQVRLPVPLYVYAFSFERLDDDKHYLYFIQQLGGSQQQLKPGKTIFPSGNAGFGFSVSKELDEGYPIYFKVFALEEPVFLLTQDQKKKGETISWLSPDMAKRFLNQIKDQKAKGKRVYTTELTKFLEK